MGDAVGGTALHLTVSEWPSPFARWSLSGKTPTVMLNVQGQVVANKELRCSPTEVLDKFTKSGRRKDDHATAR